MRRVIISRLYFRNGVPGADTSGESLFPETERLCIQTFTEVTWQRPSPPPPPPLLGMSLVVPQPCPILQSRGKLPDDTALSDVQKGKWPCSQDHAQPGPAPALCPGADPAHPRRHRTPPAEGLSGEGRWAPTPAFSTCSLKGAPLPPCHLTCHSQQEGRGHLSESIHIAEPQHRGWRRDRLVM